MTLIPFRAPQKRHDPGKWLMIAAVFVLSFLLFDQMILRTASDLSIHTTWAGEGDFRDPVSFLRHGAHPMWHALVVVVTLTGLPLRFSSALVTALCKAAEVWLIHRLLTVALHKRMSRSAITLFALICSVVTSLCVPFFNPRVYYDIGSPNTWHSLTQMIAMVFMLLCVPCTAYIYDRFEQLRPTLGEKTILPWKEPVTLGVMLFLSLLAKPTFMQAFLPGACLFFLVKWIQHPKNSRYFLQIVLCVLPSALFMIVQYMYYFGIIVPWQSSMVLEITADKFLYTGARILLMLGFPLYTLWCCRKQPKDTIFWLTLVFNAVAIAEFLILGENGRRASDGNFGWGMMGATLMMWVVCLIRFLREDGAFCRKPAARYCVGWGLLAWHALSGVYYIVYLFVSGNTL